MQRIFCSPSTSSEGVRNVSARILFTAIPLIAVAFAIALLLSAPSDEDAQGASDSSTFVANCNGVPVTFTVGPGMTASIGRLTKLTIPEQTAFLKVPPYVVNPNNKLGSSSHVVG